MEKMVGLHFLSTFWGTRTLPNPEKGVKAYLSNFVLQFQIVADKTVIYDGYI